MFSELKFNSFLICSIWRAVFLGQNIFLFLYKNKFRNEERNECEQNNEESIRHDSKSQHQDKKTPVSRVSGITIWTLVKSFLADICRLQVSGSLLRPKNQEAGKEKQDSARPCHYRTGENFNPKNKIQRNAD